MFTRHFSAERNVRDHANGSAHRALVIMGGVGELMEWNLDDLGAAVRAAA